MPRFVDFAADRYSAAQYVIADAAGVVVNMYGLVLSHSNTSLLVSPHMRALQDLL
jgi:hypothetical protein